MPLKPRRRPYKASVITAFFKNLNRALYNKWKMYCLKRQISMKERFIELIKEDVKNDEKLLLNSKRQAKIHE